jgi:Fic family protein
MPKGKPLHHTLMVTDHFKALRFVIEQAKACRQVSVGLIQEINALVMKSTGNVYTTVFGEIDAARGMFRKGNVSAGISYFPNYDKVERMTVDLVKAISEKMKSPDLTLTDKINLYLMLIFP